MADTADAPTIDREALRAKYREERDKRLRPDGNEQYLEPTGKYLPSFSVATSVRGRAPVAPGGGTVPTLDESPAALPLSCVCPSVPTSTLVPLQPS